MSEELKPCPFCGGSDLLRDPYYDESAVRCQTCHTTGPIGDFSDIDRLWNARPAENGAKALGASQAVVALEVERLKKAH